MSRSSSHNSRGFTLIELMVSLAIVGIIVSVILGNQSSYTESAALWNVADEVSLRVSEAQAYGIAVKERNPGSSDFSGGYGLSFSLLSDGSNALYITFADTNADGVYNGTTACEANGECIEKVAFNGGNYLDDICIVKKAGADDCGTPKRADITFLRPDPAARIAIFSSSGNQVTQGSMVGIRLNFKSPSGLTRSVLVYTNGQISVQ